jgi:hypothetical protein
MFSNPSLPPAPFGTIAEVADDIAQTLRDAVRLAAPAHVLDGPTWAYLRDRIQGLPPSVPADVRSRIASRARNLRGYCRRGEAGAALWEVRQLGRLVRSRAVGPADERTPKAGLALAPAEGRLVVGRRESLPQARRSSCAPNSSEYLCSKNIPYEYLN